MSDPPLRSRPVSDKPFRILPAVTPENSHFWRGGADGELRILRCSDCGYWIHPPVPVCPNCLSRNLAPQATSGRATVHTYTVNHQAWIPTLDPPYVVAIVELPEQDGLRLTTNIVGIDPEDVTFEMDVQVVFEEYADGDESVWLPFFEPVGPAS